jgi:thiosulfate/3-mercaptopyruvate sulfurtransferase
MTAAASSIADRGYAHPEVLVGTDWVAEHLNDPSIRIVESNEDQLLYPSGHIPGAVQVDWAADLNDQVRRDYLNKDGFEKLMSRIGATKDTTVVFYGDKNNWWATYAFWVFQLFGHKNAKVMDGGRLKWEQEGRELTREVKQYAATSYSAPERDDKSIRIFRDEVLKHQAANKPLVDVRSPAEYSGEKTHMPEYPQEGVLRGGHIPGAKSVPWARAANPDNGTFKSAADLKALRAGTGPQEGRRYRRLLPHRRAQ